MHAENTPRALIITGTDTGIGKTYVTAGLLRAFQKEHLAAQAVKIVQTGIEDADLLVHDDARVYADFVADLPQREDLPPARVLFSFPTPASPFCASHEVGRNLSVRTNPVQLRFNGRLRRFQLDRDFKAAIRSVLSPEFRLVCLVSKHERMMMRTQGRRVPQNLNPGGRIELFDKGLAFAVLLIHRNRLPA